MPPVMNHTEIVLDEWHHLTALLSGEHSDPILLTGKDLTIPQIVSVARHNARIEISPAAVESMERSLRMLEQKLHNGEVIYGVNTGFGGTADVRTQQFVEIQRALVRELHYGILPPTARDPLPDAAEDGVNQHRHDLFLDNNNEQLYLPWSWTRAAILIRINSLISGCSAVRPVITERMQDLLKHDLIPMIPLRGSISASGDLSPLSYICGAIQGKSTIRLLSRGSQDLYADMAMASTGLAPVTLQAKEGLAMTNGTTVSAAAAALALHDTHGLALIAQILTAMSVEALVGTTESFSPFFSEIRPHPGQIESARNILAFLSGSKLTQVNDGVESSLRQDRYSIRTAPQWLGPILEDLVLSHQQLAIECNSVTDNPLVTAGGESLHGGNFQAKAVTSSMEKARQGIQGIGRMLFSQCTEIINPATNRGLPPNLLAEDPSISLIFKGTDLNIASLTAELGFLAGPVNHVQTAEMGNQSLNSLALISARYTHTANEVLSQLMAAHMIAVCQALDLRAMHIQFLELYQSTFFELVAKHCNTDGPTAPVLNKTDVGITGLDDYSDPSTISTPSLSLQELSNGSLKALSKGSKSEAVDGLSKLLWAQLLKAFDSTTSMDADGRFQVVAKSLRSVLLDNPNFFSASNFVKSTQDFTEAVASSLYDAWCTHRDAYLVHGDASAVLGRASKAIYTFVRRTLKVPLLATKQLMTPSSKELANGLGFHGTHAPTVGSYTSVVYRSLRDGTLAKVAVDVLKASV
ncbi:phenylalanine ammonia-lyase [Lentithecium fluviatile CBS 122367]|uniref:Phenylalanine ammonia-lyase n=1 Tax=Lentithecium fluviatile CBS 122367 TaxID=1168545 RepID=A0A6G1IEG7_9PLEO|nr:phenylalanine ammonia-lyase [Lentithecium fluviatile CBS 122367]